MITREEIAAMQVQVSYLQEKLDLLLAAKNKREKEHKLDVLEIQLSRTFNNIGDIINSSEDVRRQRQLDTMFNLIHTSTGFSKGFLITTRRSRKRHLVEPRQVIMSLSNCLFRNETLRESGAIFGKDHATVLNARKVVSSLMQTSREFKETYASVFNYAKSINKKAVEKTFGV